MLKDDKHFCESVRKALAHSAREKIPLPILFILKRTAFPLRTDDDEGFNTSCLTQAQDRILGWAHHMDLDLDWCVRKKELHVLIVANKKARALDSLALSLLEALKHPFQRGSSAPQPEAALLETRFALGIALPISETTSEENLEEMARAALRQSMEHELSTYCVFAFSSHELETALAEDQFTLVYQPQYSVDGEKFEGVEALVRWDHPRYGTILPRHFIPIAERSGFIVTLGAWILHRACLDGARWTSLRVGVNVSPQQFSIEGFSESLALILQATGMAPERLELELTEEGPIADVSALKEVIACLKRLGIHLALDDFGEGRSRFQELKRLTFDTLKLPPSLVEDIENDEKSLTLLQGLIRLGHELKLRLIVEGVENAKQQAILQELGCDTVQGFFYAKPTRAANIDALLIAHGKNRALA